MELNQNPFMDNEEIFNKIEEVFFHIEYDDHIKDKNKLTNNHSITEEIHYYHQKNIKQEDIKYIIIKKRVINIREINMIHSSHYLEKKESILHDDAK